MLSKVFIFINLLILIVFFSSFLSLQNTEFKTINTTPSNVTASNYPSPSVFEESKTVLDIPILMYHSIANYSDIAINDKNPSLSHGLRIPPLVLNRQLELIKKSGYTTIKFEDLNNYIKLRQPLPAKPIILTFDDGWTDNLIAYNKLKELGMIGNFAIVTSYIDTPKRLSSAQIKEFSDNGMEISSHSMTHANLSILNNSNLKNELSNSKKTLENLIGKEVNTIVYPTGAYNKAVIDEAISVGYRFGVNTKGYENIQDLTKPFELTRVRVQCNVGFSIRDDNCGNLGGNFFLKM